MRTSHLFLLAFIFSAARPAVALISYIDEKGTKHYVADESEIPERYRGQPKGMKPAKGAKAAKPAPALPAARQSPDAPVPKDLPAAAFDKNGEVRPIAYMLKGAALYDAGRFAEAAEFYEKALQLNAKNPELKGEGLDRLHSQLADAYFFQNKFAEAIPLMKQVLEAGRSDPKTQAHNHFNLACAYHELGLMNDAAAELRSALASAKASPELLAKYESMARTDKQLAKLQARPDFEKIVKGEAAEGPKAAAPPAATLKGLFKPLQVELDAIASDTQAATTRAASDRANAGKVAGQLMPPLIARTDKLIAELEKLPAGAPTENALVRNRIEWMRYQRKVIEASLAILTGGNPPAGFDSLPQQAEKLGSEGERLRKELGW